jgi:hypothetical protein
LKPSRRRRDIGLLEEHATLVGETAAPPDADGLRGQAIRPANEIASAVARRRR